MISRGPFAVISEADFDVTVEITGQALSSRIIADGEPALQKAERCNKRSRRRPA